MNEDDYATAIRNTYEYQSIGTKLLMDEGHTRRNKNN